MLTVEEFRDKVRETKVKCPYCNFRGHSIVAHLSEAHNLTAGQVKKQHEQVLLVSPVVSELMRQLNRVPAQSDAFEEFVPLFSPSLEAEKTLEALKTAAASKVPTDPLVKELVPTPDTGFYLAPAFSKAVGFAMIGGKNAYVEGPTGCGKTDGVWQLHAQLGLPVIRVNMNGDVTVASFIGTREADPQKGTYFKHGDLPTAMKLGVTLLIDEIDYMPPHIAAVLNPVLEKKRVLHLPETGETIVAKEGFNVIATANTGGKGDTNGVYTGTETLNTALLDRFSVKVTTDYLPEEKERDMLLKRFPQAEAALIEKLVKIAIEVRKSFKAGLLPVTISTRKLIEILDMNGHLGLPMAVDLAILNWLDEDNRLMVVKLIENHGLDVSK